MLHNFDSKTPSLADNESSPSYQGVIGTSAAKKYLSSTMKGLNRYQLNNFSTHCRYPSQHCSTNYKTKSNPNQQFMLEDPLISQFHTSLTQSEKLSQIESIITECRKLISFHGYFYITRPMIEFQNTPNNPKCQVRPFNNPKKPLLPIMKKTRKEAERQFYLNLKQILKSMYPTISLPEGNTEEDFYSHFKQLRKIVNKKKISYQSLVKLNQTTEALYRVRNQEQTIKQKQKVLRELVTKEKQKSSWKKRLTKKCKPKQSQTMSYLKVQNECRLEYQKNTMSTLWESIKSNASLKDKVIKNKAHYLIVEDKGRKKSVIVQKKQDESEKDFQQDFDELFSSEEHSTDEVQESVIRELQNILQN